MIYGNGVHTKHHHMNCHVFFIRNTRPTEKVVDFGCGLGAVALSLAEKIGCFVTGVDMSLENIDKANKKFNHPSVTHLHGDVLDVLTEDRYDVVVYSNALEHLVD